MYHKGYVVLLIVVMLGLASAPLILANSGKGFEYVREELEKPKGDHCIESKDYMSKYHMELLNEWREMAIREGKRLYISNGEIYNASIYECFNCHKYEEFCSKCHEFGGVEVYCWTCHTPPE